ncbi:MAG: translation initiation factor IF-2 subunit gamma [Candidatus Korarchaeota archaeon]
MSTDVEILQPDITVGTAGHVEAGKSTLIWALTKVWTFKYSEEIERGITIKLGYADTSIRYCPDHGDMGWTTGELSGDTCPLCGKKTRLVRKVSFLDSPGHEMLMATMLTGTALMDSAILVIAANEPCPRPQTREHLHALKIAGITGDRLLVVQSKVELVSKEDAKNNYNQIVNFLNSYGYYDVPVIPVSSVFRANIDIVARELAKLPQSDKDPNAPPLAYTSRSFDVNKPGTAPENLYGGVVGGSIVRGVLRVGDEILISPGIVEKDKWTPLSTKIASLKLQSGEALMEAKPGGLIGIGTYLDPSVTRADNLAGQIITHPDNPPIVQTELTITPNLMDRVIGSEHEEKIESIKQGMRLVLHSATSVSVGEVTNKVGDKLELKLLRPLPIIKGNKVTLSMKLGSGWRLIGWGTPVV